MPDWSPFNFSENRNLTVQCTNVCRSCIAAHCNAVQQSQLRGSRYLGYLEEYRGV